MILLDINFDSIWYNELIHKLIKLKFHPKLIKFLHIYLHNRLFLQIYDKKF